MTRCGKMQAAAQREFIAFVLSKYVEGGVDELDESKLSGMIHAKYHTIEDAERQLVDLANVRETFIQFQKYLYQQYAA